MYKKLKKLLFFSTLLVNGFVFSLKRAEKKESCNSLEEYGSIKKFTFSEQSFFLRNDDINMRVEITPYNKNHKPLPTIYLNANEPAKEFRFINKNNLYEVETYIIWAKHVNGTIERSVGGIAENGIYSIYNFETREYEWGFAFGKTLVCKKNGESCLLVVE